MTRKPNTKWEKLKDSFCYDIREPKTDAIFVYVDSKDSTKKERDAALHHILTWGRDSIKKGRIHYLRPASRKS